MSCYYPIQGWMSRGVNHNGNRYVVFKRSEGFEDMPLKIRCNQCIGCRVDRATDWAIRCVHEASLHKENTFITLTYDPEHLPEYGNLSVPIKDSNGKQIQQSDFQAFMKRFRQYLKRKTDVDPKTIKYFYCGEYGEKRGRPHYHALIFGYQFPDLEFYEKRKGNNYYFSETLNKIWGKGNVIIGSVTFQSAHYVARYTTKKITGLGKDEVNPKTGLKPYERICAETGQVIEMNPEYAQMSRRPGIAKEWLEQYGQDAYPKDFVTVNGKKFKIPKYYDNLMTEIDDKIIRKVKARRRLAAKDHLEDNTYERLVVREKVAKAKLSLKSGDL